MHPNRYVWADGEARVSKFDKTMPEKPRRRYEFSVWRNQQRILYARLAKMQPLVLDEPTYTALMNKYMNKYRNPKGRWTKKES